MMTHLLTQQRDESGCEHRISCGSLEPCCGKNVVDHGECGVAHLDYVIFNGKI